MRKVIAAINMTLDGFCNHEAMAADDEMHEHYNALLRNADTMLFGRKTYKLMESYWPSVVKDPTGNKATDTFALLIDGMQKIVFSSTQPSINWKNAMLKNSLKEEVMALRDKEGSDILAASPSLIDALTQWGLIDEYQITVHPTVLGSGLPLFKNITQRVNLKLLKTKIFECGAVTLYYEPEATT